jgi:hypothetical protein
MANKAGIGCAPLLVLGLIVVGISRCFGGGGDSSTDPYAASSSPGRVRATDYQYTQAASLKCRSEPSTTAQRVESLSEGTFVGVARTEDGWSLLDRSPPCWVASRYLGESRPVARPASLYSSSGGGSGRSHRASGRRSGGAFANCAAARAAGADPVYAGDPGYGSHLDRDGDGVGCE